MAALEKPLPLLRLVAILVLTIVVGLDGPFPKQLAADEPSCVRSAMHAVPGGTPEHPLCNHAQTDEYCYQCAEVTNDDPGFPYYICTGGPEMEDDTGPCGHFAELPSWFGSDPDQQGNPFNQDPGLGD